MDPCCRNVASARSAWWRTTAQALGTQPPLVTLRSTPTGGGELITWFADGADAVTALTSALQLPPPAEGVRLETVAAAVAQAVVATYAADVSGPGAAPHAAPPTVTLYDGVPATLVESWASVPAMLATAVPGIERAADTAVAGTMGVPAAPPPEHRRSSTAKAVKVAAVAAGVAGVAAVAAAAARRSRSTAARVPDTPPTGAAAGAAAPQPTGAAAGAAEPQPTEPSAAVAAQVAELRRASAARQHAATMQTYANQSRMVAQMMGTEPTHYINGVPSYGGVRW